MTANAPAMIELPNLGTVAVHPAGMHQPGNMQSHSIVGVGDFETIRLSYDVAEPMGRTIWRDGFDVLYQPHQRELVEQVVTELVRTGSAAIVE